MTATTEQVVCRITTDPIDAQELIDAVQTRADGAVCVFYGVVREDSRNKKVRWLEYDAYPEMAESEMARIAETLRARHEIHAVAMVHRVGEVPVGEASVAIAAAHPHRAPAFDAARAVIEELKRRVPIWKCEEYADGTRDWVDPTAHAGAPAP